ncbi:MAG: M1 family aminopeptidase [Bacteroidales bacterium]
MIKKTTLILSLTLLSLSSLLGQVNVKHYDLDYELDFVNNKLFGVAKLSISGQEDTLNLLLYRLLKVTSITDSLGNSIDFTQEVVSFEGFEELQVNHIQISLPNQNKSILTLRFNGYVLGYAETGMKYVKDHISPEFTIIRMDAFSYPVLGRPSVEDLRASATNNFFDYNISVTIPDSLNAVTLGKVTQVSKHAKQTRYAYQSIQPTWRVDVAVGKYATLKKNNFNIHYFKEDSAGARRVLRAVEQTSELYNSWFGKKDLANFTIIEIEDGYGSQTDKCGIIQTATAFKQSEYLEEVYHEISHLWNVPHIDKAPCRLESEGLAMFLQFLVKEKIENKNNYLEERAQSTLKKVKKQIADSEEFSSTPIIEYGEKNITDYSYYKGMLFFYVLYHTVGEEAFFKAMKGYYITFENSGSTTKEFAEYLKNNFKSNKVDKLVNDWIFTSQSTSYLLSCEKAEDLWK